MDRNVPIGGKDDLYEDDSLDECSYETSAFELFNRPHTFRKIKMVFSTQHKF